MSENSFSSVESLTIITTVGQLYMLRSIMGKPTKAEIPVVTYFRSSNRTACANNMSYEVDRRGKRPRHGERGSGLGGGGDRSGML